MEGHKETFYTVAHQHEPFVFWIHSVAFRAATSVMYVAVCKTELQVRDDPSLFFCCFASVFLLFLFFVERVGLISG